MLLSHEYSNCPMTILPGQKPSQLTKPLRTLARLLRNWPEMLRNCFALAKTLRNVAKLLRKLPLRNRFANGLDASQLCQTASQLADTLRNWSRGFRNGSERLDVVENHPKSSEHRPRRVFGVPGPKTFIF